MKSRLYFTCIIISKLFLFIPALAYGNWSSSEKNAQIYFGAGAYLAKGTMGNKSGSINTRAMNSVVGYAQLGLKSGFIMPFLYGEFGQSEQTTEATSVGNTNMSGSSQLAGLGLKINMQRVYVSATYLPIGSYSLSRSTSGNQNVTYLEPLGFTAQIGFNTDWFQFFVQRRQVEYSKQKLGSTITNLNDNKIVQEDWGGGIQWGFTWSF